MPRRISRLSLTICALALGAGALLVGCAAPTAGGGETVTKVASMPQPAEASPRRTRRTPAVSSETAKALDYVQKAVESKDYERAFEALAALARQSDSGPYEHTTIRYFSAWVCYEMGDLECSIADYESVLATEDVPARDRRMLRQNVGRLRQEVETSRILAMIKEAEAEIGPDTPGPANVQLTSLALRDKAETILRDMNNGEWLVARAKLSALSRQEWGANDRMLIDILRRWVLHTLLPLYPPPPESAGMLTIVRMEPRYPPNARARRIEGHVLVEYTVTELGTVKDPIVIEAEPTGIFEEAAISSVRKFKYRPQLMPDGTGWRGMSVRGVRTLVKFEIKNVRRER